MATVVSERWTDRFLSDMARRKRLSIEVFTPYWKDNAFRELRADHEDVVEFRGSTSARIMLVGEAPGENEQIEGIPFVGMAGQVLDKVLRKVGLEENDVYVTNIVKFRPPQNRDPSRDEVASSRPYLLREIEIVRPKVVVPLGRHSLSAFFSNLLITQARGSVLRYQKEVNVKVCPTFHPQATVYDKEKLPLFEEDLRQVALRFGGKRAEAQN